MDIINSNIAEIQSLLSLGIVGVIVSIFVQYIKSKFGIESMKAKLLTVLVSIAVATFYVFIKDTQFFGTFVAILAIASTFYAFIFSGSKTF